MDFTTALARLLSDPVVREAYATDRRRTARRLSVRDADLDAFVSLDVADLMEQAEGLLRKRFHEAKRLLPSTLAQLGPQARAHFHAYATARWPEGHRRHLDDAESFCRYLTERGVSGVCPAEWNRMRFATSQRRWSVHLIRELRVDGRPRVRSTGGRERQSRDAFDSHRRHNHRRRN